MFTRIAAVALCLLVSCTGMVLAEAPEARANGKRLNLPPIPRFTYRIKFEMTYAGHVAIRIKDRAFQDVPAAGYRATLVIERADGNLGPFYLEPAGGISLKRPRPKACRSMVCESCGSMCRTVERPSGAMTRRALYPQRTDAS